MTSDPSSLHASVVVPFATGLDLLERQLDALAAQTGVVLEVIVSVNRQEELGRVAHMLAERQDPYVLRILDSSARPGASGARNVGWRAARNGLVLFCDADDVCDPGWAAAMIAELDRHEIVRGLLDYDSLNPAGFSTSRVAPHDDLIAFRHLPYGPTCCLGARRGLLERLDGFDETLTAAEDIDLSWRAQYQGATLGFAHDAVVNYRLRRSFRAVYQQGLRYGEADVRLYRLHRPFGARRLPLDAVSNIAALGVRALLAVRGRSSRLKLGLELGIVVGHLRGSLTCRMVFL